MSTKLYYTQGIRDFQVKGTNYSEEKLEIRLVRKKHRCPDCGSRDITTGNPLRERCARSADGPDPRSSLGLYAALNLLSPMP